MLTLIIGGAFQGKYEFALTLKQTIINNLQDIIKEFMLKKVNVDDEILTLISGEDKIIICREIGCGIVPLEKSEREYREITGRILCDIAKKADCVYRVQAGIPTKIKG